MIELALIPYMAITARQSGGGLGAQYLPRWLTWLPEALFALGFGYVALMYSNLIFSIIATAWSYLWMQTGHGTVLPWGRNPSAAIGRKQTLTPIVDALCNGFSFKVFNRSRSIRGLGFKIGDVNYCRLFMAVKGFLIGLPVGGLPLLVLWPLSYEIGVRVKRHEVSELLSGAFSGVVLCVSLFIIKG